jgi:hypothetical protein
MWNKQQRIEFFNSDPSIVDTFPIIESKDLKLNWVKGTREDYQKQAKSGNTDQPGFAHLLRCPGIFDLFKYGYIIPLNKDISITPKGKEFDSIFKSVTTTEFATRSLTPFSIEWQGTDFIGRPPWAADFIIKINTGWHVIAPKGVKLLMLPIVYPDTFDFTAAAGILDPSISTLLNFQLFWNSKKTETIIPAGTPLGQLIPITEKKYEWVQRTMNQKDRDWARKHEYAFGSTFWPHTVRKKVVAMYNKYWNGEI